MAKTILKTYDLKEMFKSIFNNYSTKTLQIVNKYDGTTDTTTFVDYLDVEFYDYKYDIKDHNLLETEDGFQFPNLDNWLNSRGNTTKTYALVELTSQELTPSVDIDMGSATAKITFVIQQDKIYALEEYIAYIQRRIIGEKNTILNTYGSELIAYYNILNFAYENEPINTPLGKSIIASLEFNVAYLESATTYTDLGMTFSLDGDEYYDLTFNEMKQDFAFTGKSNLKQNKPYASGTINTALSYIQTFTFWAYKKDYFVVQLKYLLKKLIDDDTNTSNINIPVWVKEDVDWYDEDNDTYTTEEMTTKMVVVDFNISVKNSDFAVCSMTLNRYGKV